MKKIITVTMNPSLDKSTSVKHVMNDKKMRCEPPRYEPGGGGINVSRAIRNLGGESLAIFPEGGFSGQYFNQLLSEENIPYQSVHIDGFTRENMMFYERTSGRQYRFGMPGPLLSTEEWQQFIKIISERDQIPEYFVLSGSLPRGVPHHFYAELAAELKNKGARIIVDTYGDPLRMAAEEGVYLLKPNIRELQQLVERDFDIDQELETVLEEIYHKKFAELIVVSLGSAGAMYISENGLKKIPAPTVKIQSKIGAGDSMVAGFVLGFVRDMTINDAILFGVAAGSAAVMSPGSGLCKKEDTDRLFEKLKKDNP